MESDDQETVEFHERIAAAIAKRRTAAESAWRLHVCLQRIVGLPVRGPLSRDGLGRRRCAK
jgi:hypothetical protein